MNVFADAPGKRFVIRDAHDDAAFALHQRADGNLRLRVGIFIHYGWHAQAATRLVHNTPGAVRIAAGSAHAFLRLAADRNFLRVFAAVLTVGSLVIVRGNHYAGVAALRVAPGESL